MKKMFFLLTIVVFMVLFVGCYVPMPSTGITPARIHHKEVCAHIGVTGELHCTHTRTYVK